eukprot:scaffold22668_cov161-Cylindrotheca_fusiformis.AAC.4
MDSELAAVLNRRRRKNDSKDTTDGGGGEGGSGSPKLDQHLSSRRSSKSGSTAGDSRDSRDSKSSSKSRKARKDAKSVGSADSQARRKHEDIQRRRNRMAKNKKAVPPPSRLKRKTSSASSSVDSSELVSADGNDHVQQPSKEGESKEEYSEKVENKKVDETDDPSSEAGGRSSPTTKSDDSSSDEEEHDPKRTQASTSFFSADEGFAAFPQDVASPSLPGPTNFGTSEVSFGNFDSTPATFDATFQSSSTDFGVAAAAEGPDETKSDVMLDDYVPPSFALPTASLKPMFDKTPIEEPPTVPRLSTSLRLNNKKTSSKIYSSAQLPASPTANPLTGNVIMAKETENGDLFLCEFNPHTRAQVTSFPILNFDLQRSVASKFNVTASGVDSVLTVACGLHGTNSGRTLARVACLLDLLVLDNNEVLRVIAVYQWGYAGGTDSIQLQSLLSPPSGSDFTYNTTSLLVADSCVFVSGASAKGPCVFLCKPTVRETWSANFVGKHPHRIASMAVTNTTSNVKNRQQRLPYLAIALTDGSLSIWTYHAATQVTSKTTEALRRLLYPLCRLDVRPLMNAQVVKLTNKDIFKDDENADEKNPQTKDVGYCTHLGWSCPNAASNPNDSLLILGASFQGGVLFFHISLPKIKDKAKRSYVDLAGPTHSTQLGSTVAIHPFGTARWPAVYHKTSISFVDVGPHMPLTVAVLAKGLSKNLDYSRLALVSYILPPYRGSVKDLPAGSMHVWDSREWNGSNGSRASPPRELVSCTYVPGVMYLSSRGLEVLNFSRWARSALRNPTSIPFGLTTSGNPYLGDAVSDRAGILHVFTTYHCERRKVVYGESSSEFLEWSIPSRRHWLIQTSCGDCKESFFDDVQHRVENKNDDDAVYGGSHAKVMVEVTPTDSSKSDLIPYRIVRDFKGLYTAVWFQGIANTTQRIALVERSSDETKVVQWLKHEREIVFLPDAMDEDLTTPIPQMLVLSPNGGSICLWQRKQELESWQPAVGIACRPILGLSASALSSSHRRNSSESNSDGSEYVDTIQMTLQRWQDQVGLLVAARRTDGRVCILSGPLQLDEGLVWSDLLPNIQEDPVLWMDETEEICSIVPLPFEQTVRGGVAVASTKRILILSPELHILAQVKVTLPPTSLVPIGSYTVAYCSQDDHAIKYLSGVPSSFGASGLIASLPLPRYTYCPHLLLAIRPDRLIYTCYHNGSRLVERGQSTGTFMLPSATTRPALLLEPMIANAIATGGGPDAAKGTYLRSVVEKFGRKVSTMTHGEDEGIGNWGAGMTPRVYELLGHYGLQGAASWLLTGTVHFDRSANSRLLPSWMPVSAKVKAAIGDADTYLHVIANGDQYFSEYVKNPDSNMASTLPRPSDPSAFLCNEFGMEALKQGKAVDAMKLLDIVGTESSDAMLLQLALAWQMDPSKDVAPILEALSQSHDSSQIEKSVRSTTAASLAALSLELRANRGVPSEDFCKKWTRPLAPSFQRGKKFARLRPRIIGESAFAKTRIASQKVRDETFSTEMSEMKLVWNEGPNREKENLLMLDGIQDWFGRRRPAVLGKEGVKSAEVRGATTLADILRQDDDDSFGEHDDGASKDGWVDGVGEGLKDEDKLSAYFRLSEGEDEEDAWRQEGFADITRFENKAVLVGCADTAKLEVSTSSVDEGEGGKVKSLFDLVFTNPGVGMASALALPASRGGSLDIGMMHDTENMSRHKCSIEFWFWVPSSIKETVILARRTFGASADDLENVAKANDKRSLLWELALTPNGELAFETIAGAKLKSEYPTPPTNTVADDEHQKSTVRFGYWNHVCITFKQESITTSSVNVLVKGVSSFSDKISFSPPNFEVDEFSGASALDSMLEKSYLVFGLNHPEGFRLTELRAWALARADDDIRTMMTEYLNCAEIRKKFAVKIKKKAGGSGKVGILSPPKGSETAGATTNKGMLRPPKGMLSPPKGGLSPPPRRATPRKGLLAPPKADNPEGNEELPSTFDNAFGFGMEAPSTKPPANAGFSSDAFGGFDMKDSAPATFDSAFGDTSSFQPSATTETFEPMESGMQTEAAEMPDETPEISPLWDSAIPLSEQVRSSAAAALIRGPPATRHFGGNRGGLPDYRELERYVCHFRLLLVASTLPSGLMFVCVLYRFGVGAISICGSEKTIVWRDDQAPPGLTYPIGASGAIVSDQMDDGNEFLCCFLAKDKRMVVFDLSTRTVVVELQMTTKLNFWRFLPPEAGEDTLCFMLVTPVGGFHWMPLDVSPKPRQVWKRGPELRGKKIVCYEEGGTNGLDGLDMLSKVGMLLVTNAATGGFLETWLVPICGDSQALCAHDNVLGACLCSPPDVGYEAWMPLLLFVLEAGEDLVVCVSAVTETSEVSIGLTDVMTDALIELAPYKDLEFEPPTLAMGSWPEVLCCSLGTTIVIIVRRKGLVVAYELAETGLELIAQENVGHFVVDAVMRYSALEGGAEIVLLMSDSENPRDGRVGTFCFRTVV